MHSLALRADGMVAVWGGDNSFSQTNVPGGLSNVMAISTRWDYNLALRADGTLAVWGDNSVGQTNAPVALNNVVVCRI